MHSVNFQEEKKEFREVYIRKKLQEKKSEINTRQMFKKGLHCGESASARVLVCA